MKTTWRNTSEIFGRMWNRWLRAYREPTCATPQVSPLRPNPEGGSVLWNGVGKPPETPLEMKYRWL